MASLLNNASLLLNPAGSTIAYKEDKIFSVLPSNGTGDFTFSGGDGGTRVNQQGYIEQTPANLLIYSEDLSNGVWIKQNSPTVTSNTVLAPNGTLTADTVILSTGKYVYQVISLVAGQTYTLSAYIRVSSGTNTFKFNIFGSGNNFTSSTITATSEWQRFSFTFTAVATGNTGMYPLIVDGLAGGTFYVWGSMINIGSTARPYQPTTDRLNYPRITYQNGKGALLSELQRTNQLLYSNKFDEIVWNKTNVGVTASATISPDGTNNAWKLVPNTSVGAQFVLQNSSVTSGTRYVQTVFAKAGEYQWLQFAPSTGFASSYVNFNLANGTVGTNTSGFLATITPFKDGWYRCSLACTSTNTGTGRIVIAPIQSDSQGRLPAWAGDGTSGIYIYGAQLESGGHPSIVVNINYPTSYIPTTSATVSRPGDVAIDSSVSSLVSQNDGTLYISGVSLNFQQEFMALSPNGFNTSNMVIFYQTSGVLRAQCIANSSTIIIGNLTIPVGNYFKAAIRYKNGDSAVYINGQQRAANSTAFSFTSTLNRINIQSNRYFFALPGSHELSTVATYTTGLTNTQLAELTTIHSGSGGNISYYGPYTIHTFTGSATFTPSFNGEVEVLVVAGGGGGGGAESNFNGGGGGGGGAGGLLYVSSYGVTAGVGITITIGAGGSGGTIDQNNATNGSNSIFGGLTAIGGGRGGADQGPNVPGVGGSGGGAGGDSGVAGANGIPGQGNKGGDDLASSRAAGGGGGAGAAGQNSTDSSGVMDGTAGGDGLSYSITGFSTYYAGGGGGGGSNNFSGTIPNSGLGGLGGGGNSVGLINGTLTSNTSGVPNTGGGGGGGANSTTAGNGGSGIVILRYLT
jgi:hypothetical protein